uniref:Uncharacterized protein n=1 Tax=Caenorhabditis japonica TaxID=281687 RepID=A0A8R1ESR8_CAEJA
MSQLPAPVNNFVHPSVLLLLLIIGASIRLHLPQNQRPQLGDVHRVQSGHLDEIALVHFGQAGAFCKLRLFMTMQMRSIDLPNFETTVFRFKSTLLPTSIIFVPRAILRINNRLSRLDATRNDSRLSTLYTMAYIVREEANGQF